MTRAVLVVGPSWIGDMVMAQSLFIDLRRREPDVAIDVVAPEWSRPLLARMPEVRRAVGLPAAHGRLALAARWRVGRSLRGRGYERAIVLPRSLKAALVPFFAAIPRRTGFRGEQRYGLINDMRPLGPATARPMVQAYLALGAPRAGHEVGAAPHPRLRVDAPNRQRLVAALGLDRQRPVAACVPGAEYGPAKAWPAEAWRDLVGRLVGEGYRVWILGSAGERELGRGLAAVAPRQVDNLCGRTRLGDAVDLLSLARIAFCNDTGLMHVAAAVGAPVTAIYGSSSPRYTPPLTDRAAVRYLDLDCSPCFERRCPLGHYRCLREISVDSVFAAARGLLACGPGGPA